jgi:hypothetical protein
VVWVGVTSIGVLAIAAWAGWEALVERYHRWLLRHGSEPAAFRAAAALTAGNEDSLELVRAWALELAREAARAPARAAFAAYLQEETHRAIEIVIARKGNPGRVNEGRRVAPPREPTAAEVSAAIAEISRAHTPEDSLGAAKAARTLVEADRKDEARDGTALALRLASQLPDRDHKYSEDAKAAPFAAIAGVLWLLGEVEESRRLFTQAAILTSGKNEHLVTREQAELGDLEGATRTALAIQKQKGGWGGLDHVAEVQIRKGELQDAGAIADELRDPRLMASIGAEQRRRGDAAGAERSFEHAYAVAGAIPASTGGSPARCFAHGRIAYEEARSGPARRALAVALVDTAPYSRANLLLGVANGLEERLRELAAR